MHSIWHHVLCVDNIISVPFTKHLMKPKCLGSYVGYWDALWPNAFLNMQLNKFKTCRVLLKINTNKQNETIPLVLQKIVAWTHDVSGLMQRYLMTTFSKNIISFQQWPEYQRDKMLTKSWDQKAPPCFCHHTIFCWLGTKLSFLWPGKGQSIKQGTETCNK